MLKVVGDALRDVLGLIYPMLCLGCKTELLGNENMLCVNCRTSLPVTRFHLMIDNPVEQRFAGRVSIEHATSVYYFSKESNIQEMLHALKYRNKIELGQELGSMMAQELSDCEWLSSVDVMVPVPLSRQKQHKRGYNQSELLATGIKEITQIPINTSALIRQKNTRSQTTMHVTERLDNVKDAFKLIQPEAFRNKHALLIDDVLTTGATLESCAYALNAIEGIKLSFLTLVYALD